MRMPIALISLVFLFSTSCSQPREVTRAHRGIASLRFLGEHVVPFDYRYKETLVGGLSGIDYDSASNDYYIISDNRGEHGKVRVYKADIGINSSGITDVTFRDVIYLRNSANNFYDTTVQHGNPDPESVRWNRKTGRLCWASEGERTINGSHSTLLNPSIQFASSDGSYQGELNMSKNLEMTAKAKGPRQNGTLEGLTFDPSHRYLYASCEEPLYEDAPRADTVQNGATVRLFKFDVTTGKNIAQYAYPLEQVAYAPKGSNKFRVNGISEILHLPGEDMLLVVERSFSMGRLACTVKLFVADLANADDIQDVESLKGSKRRAVEKTLLLNLDSLGIYIDNIEGITFGPRLPNGNRTLLLVADNNFNWFQLNQFLLFEVVENAVAVDAD